MLTISYRSILSSGSHPYAQFQRISNENNDYLPQISNWENIKSFILPADFVHRRFDKIQDHIEKEFKEKGMRNVFCENQYEYAKVHKCRRYANCLCRVFIRDLLQMAYYRKIDQVNKFFER